MTRRHCADLTAQLKCSSLPSPFYFFFKKKGLGLRFAMDTLYPLRGDPELDRWHGAARFYSWLSC